MFEISFIVLSVQLSSGVKESPHIVPAFFFLKGVFYYLMHCGFEHFEHCGLLLCLNKDVKELEFCTK